MDKYEKFFFEERNDITFFHEMNIFTFSYKDINNFISCGLNFNQSIEIFKKIKSCFSLADESGEENIDNFFYYRDFAKSLNVDPDLFLTKDEFIKNFNEMEKERKELHIEYKKRRKEKGYIYLIKSQRYYKIGISKNVKKRVKKFITENPNEIKVIHTYKSNDYENE